MAFRRFTPRPPEGGVCLTCGDRAEAVRVLELRHPNALVEADDGARFEVAADFMTPLNRGDTLLVHAGVAIARVLPPEQP